ncbi:aminotransferase class V-fold PLP-dependent enzyme [Rhodoglobus aureus]|uniref:aminotransferase class V-fold PLP-dependent enzyme n=1 Tax=Rhodoglobus aureus TaxID=191497 RepID=UPI0031DBBA45
MSHAQDTWRQRIEANPNRFIRYELSGHLRGVREVLGEFFAVEPDQLALLPNATYGVTSVLESLTPCPEGTVVVIGHIYPSVRVALDAFALRNHLQTINVAVPAGMATEDLEHALLTVLDARTKLVMVDQVESLSGATHPLPVLANVCRAAKIPLLVDGAHAPGPIPRPMEGLYDFWVGNLHKWVGAPRGSAVLWVGQEWQQRVRPAVYSHARHDSFSESFEWTGTFDASAWLAIPSALTFCAELGGQQLWERNRQLATAWRRDIQQWVGAKDDAVPAATFPMIGLPARSGLAKSQDHLSRIVRHISDKHRIEVVAYWHEEAPWLRLSSHAYNSRGDVGRLIAALDAADTKAVT